MTTYEDGQDSQRKEYVHLQETRDGTYPDDQRLYGFLRTQLPNHVDDWPEWYQDLFDEQASFMEFKWGLERSEAERKAEKIMRKKFEEYQELFSTIRNSGTGPD